MSGASRAQPAFLFDLDGTLVDSVYQHVVAWSVWDLLAARRANALGMTLFD